MRHPTISSDYETIRLKWPSWLPKICPHCQSSIKYRYADNGKLVHTLTGVINQIITYYVCTNENCPYFHQPFCPFPRYDYGERSYGADVFREIAEELLLYRSSIESIYLKLTTRYTLKISKRTVSRICDDILNLKAYQIDQNTKSMLEENPCIVLGIDGQDPGKNGKSLWLFMDLLTNRVIFTCVVDSINHVILHGMIEQIKAEYDVEILGFVSDKQNLLVKCCAMFYEDIPHQFCQYHFRRNTWNHLEMLDSNIFLPLKKILSKLYIHTANATVTVHFEGLGNRSVREVFAPIDQDFQKMLKMRNKTFKQLRGLWLYQTVKKYIQGMQLQAKKMDPSLRITIIFKRTYEVISAKLEKLTPFYTELVTIYPFFGEITEILNQTELKGIEQQVLLDEVYKRVWSQAQHLGLEKDLENLRSFLPKKNTKACEVLGEWCRLWQSYRTGLFQYEKFPQQLRTNNPCEQGFGKQKQAIYRRSAKKEVGYMVETRGEAYLRITHCTTEELKNDICQEYSLALMQTLREKQQERIVSRTKLWRTASAAYLGYETLLKMSLMPIS